MALRHRDSKTGRFVSGATYNRSKSHGGTRYKQEEYTPKKKQPPIGDSFPIWVTWSITFKYP